MESNKIEELDGLYADLVLGIQSVIENYVDDASYDLSKEIGAKDFIKESLQKLIRQEIKLYLKIT